MNKTISINNKKHNITNFLSGFNSKWQQPYSKNSFKYFIKQIRNKYKDIFRVFEDIDKFYFNLYYIIKKCIILMLIILKLIKIVL